jgi:hypothetical protein
MYGLERILVGRRVSNDLRSMQQKQIHNYERTSGEKSSPEAFTPKADRRALLQLSSPEADHSRSRKVKSVEAGRGF